MDLSMANQKKKAKILKIELLIILYKVHNIETLILNYKEKREEQRDKWIPFGRRLVREGGRRSKIIRVEPARILGLKFPMNDLKH